MSVKTVDYEVTATDKFTPAFQKLKSQITSTTEGFAGMQSKILALGVGGATVAGFGLLMKRMIEVADETGKAAQKAGMATDEFSKMAYAASMSDVSVQTLTKGIKGLSDMMIKAGESSSQQAALMRALGINVGGSVNDAILKVADTFKALPDGVVKTTLAVQLFGKAGQEMIPMLNQGGAGIRKLQEEAEKFGLVIRDDTAKASEQLNDNLKLLGMTSNALGIKFANEFAPALAQITDRMKEAYLEGGKLESLLVGLGGVLTLIFGDDFLTEGQKIEKQLNKLNKELDQLYTTQRNSNPGDLTKNSIFAFLGDDAVTTQINTVTAAMAELRVKRAALTAEDQKAQSVKALWAKYYADESKLEENRIRNLLAGGEAQAALLKQADAEILKLKEKGEYLLQELTLGRQLTDTEKILADLVAGKYDKFGKTKKAEIQLLAESNNQRAIEVRRVGDAAKMLDQYIKGVEAENAIREKNRDVVNDAVAALAAEEGEALDQIAMIGKTALGIEKLTAVRRIDLQVRQAIASLPIDEEGRSDPASVLRIIAAGDKAKAAIPVYKEQAAILREQMGLWDSISTGAGNFFSDLVMNGKSAFDRLRDSLKSFAAELIALFAKKWILNLVGQGSLADGAGQGTIAGSLLNGAANSMFGNALGSLFTGGGVVASNGLLNLMATGASKVGLSGVANFFGGMTGAVQGPTLTGAALGGNAAQMGATFANSTMMQSFMSVPVIGWIAAAVLKNASLFKSGWNVDSVKGPAAYGPEALTDKLLRGLGLSDKLASLLSGSSIIARIFGYGKTNMDASGIMGNITGGSFAGQNWQDMSKQGGLFHSDKRWTEFSNMTGDQSSGFADIVSGFREVLKNIGGLLGKDADKLLEGFAASFKITLKDRSAEEIQAELDAFFDNVFRDQLGLVLADTETDLMKYINSFKGTTAELIDFASAVAGIAAVLPAMDIKGISFEALDAFAASGENIVQTFARMAGQFAAANAIFDTEADQLRAAQSMVNGYFAAISEAVPRNAEQWKAWLLTIDVSTEAGRNMLNAMGELPNAFKLITDAMKNAVSTMGSLLSQIYGGTYGRQIAQSAFDSAANQWNQFLAGMGIGDGSYSAAQTFQDLLTNPDLAGQAFAALQNGQLSAEGGNLFNTLLSSFQALQQAIAGSGGVTSSVTDFGNAANNAAQQLLGSQTDIARYLRGSITSELSPLDPMQQYLQAKATYNEQLALANGGNMDARSGITGYFENFIRLSRQVNGSNGQYNTDYFGGYNQLAGLTGGQVQPYTNNTALEIQAENKALLREAIAEIRASKEATIAMARWMASEGIPVHSAEIVEAIEDNAPEAGGSGFLQSTRTPGLA